MVKKVWGVIFVVLGVGSFLLGLYKYNQVNNFVNLANTFGFPSVSDKMTSIFQNAISSAYQESYIFLGVQGPAAMAGKSQNFVHHKIGNDSIYGWDNQLGNGLILDYQIQYMGLFPLSSHLTELHYFGNIRMGTLNNEAELGFRFKFGRFTDSYMNFYGISNSRNNYHFTENDVARMSKNRRKMIPKRLRNKSLEVQTKYLNNKLNRQFQFYFFTEGMTAYWLTDGSVVGSQIQFQKNIYEYNFDDYQHILLLGRYGFVFQYKHFYMEYTRYLENDAFVRGGVFGYGRIIISVVF